METEQVPSVFPIDGQKLPEMNRFSDGVIAFDHCKWTEKRHDFGSIPQHFGIINRF